MADTGTTESSLERKKFVLSLLDTSGRGLEVAPYFNPLVDKSLYDVWYVDCIDNDEIQKKAKENPGSVGKSVPRVDSVWVPGKRLSECVGSQRFRFAVASHVFEHVPNPLGWVNEILECLEVGGSLALLIPDRRATMDYYRRTTSFGELMGWYIQKPSIPTPGQVIDFLSQSFEDTGAVDFTQEMLPFEQAKRHYTDKQAVEFAQWTVNEKRYLDVHCTVWTPESFVEVFERVNKLGVLSIQLGGPHQGFPGSIAGEFLVRMTKTA